MLQEISVSYLSVLGGLFGEQSLLRWLCGRLAQRPVIDAQILSSVCIQKKKKVPKRAEQGLCRSSCVFVGCSGRGESQT